MTGLSPNIKIAERIILNKRTKKKRKLWLRKNSGMNTFPLKIADILGSLKPISNYFKKFMKFKRIQILRIIQILNTLLFLFMVFKLQDKTLFY